MTGSMNTAGATLLFVFFDYIAFLLCTELFAVERRLSEVVEVVPAVLGFVEAVDGG